MPDVAQILVKEIEDCVWSPLAPSMLISGAQPEARRNKRPNITLSEVYDFACRTDDENVNTAAPELPPPSGMKRMKCGALFKPGSVAGSHRTLAQA